VDRQLQRAKVGCTGGGRRLAGLYRIGDAIPDVELIRRLRIDRIVHILVRLIWAAQGPPRRLAICGNVAAKRDLRVEAGRRFGHHGARLVVNGNGGRDVRIGGIDTGFEVVQYVIIVRAPPTAARCGVKRRGFLPAPGLGV
jgi:hypothetical protein